MQRAVSRPTSGLRLTRSQISIRPNNTRNGVVVGLGSRVVAPSSLFGLKSNTLPKRAYSTSQEVFEDGVEDLVQQAKVDALEAEIAAKKYSIIDPLFGPAQTEEVVKSIREHIQNDNVESALGAFDSWWLEPKESLPSEFAKEFIEFLFAKGKFAELSMYFVELTEHKPELSREFYNALWAKWREFGKFDLIADSFQQMVKSKFLGSYIVLQEFLATSKNPSLDLATLQYHGVEINRSTALIYFRALVAAGKFDQAQSYLTQSKELHPDFVTQNNETAVNILVSDLEHMEVVLKRIRAQQKGELIGEALREEVAKVNAPVFSEFKKFVQEMGILSKTEPGSPAKNERSEQLQREIHSALGVITRGFEESGGLDVAKHWIELDRYFEMDEEKEAKLNEEHAKVLELQEIARKDAIEVELQRKRSLGLSTHEDELRIAAEEEERRRRLTASDLKAMWNKAKDRSWFAKRGADEENDKIRFVEVLDSTLEILKEAKSAVKSLGDNSADNTKALKAVRSAVRGLRRRLDAAWPVGLSKEQAHAVFQDRWGHFLKLISQESLAEFTARVIREKADAFDYQSIVERVQAQLDAMKPQEEEQTWDSQADKIQHLTQKLAGGEVDPHFVQSVTAGSSNTDVHEALRQEQLRFARLALKEDLETFYDKVESPAEESEKIAQLEKSLATAALAPVVNDGPDAVRTLLHDFYSLLIADLSTSDPLLALTYFQEMREHWSKVPPALWDIIAQSLISKNHLNEALEFIEVMRRRHRFPLPETYSYLIDELSRTENVTEETLTLVFAWFRKDTLLNQVRETLHNDPLSVFRLSEYLAARERKRIGLVRSRLAPLAPGLHSLHNTYTK